MARTLENRYEFVYLFDVENGNPNGDPDAGNMPRVDPETNFGIVTDVCLKRKVRNYVGLIRGYKAPFEIFVKEGVILNQQIERAYIESEEVKNALKEWKEYSKNKKKRAKPALTPPDIAKKWMCENFFDVRTFGAVMSTGEKDDSDSKLRKTAGQVRGPVQMNFAKSVEPVLPLEISISRVCAANENKPEQFGLGPKKSIIPYGLYRAEGYISAHLAQQTGFNQDDLDLLWQAFINMFDHDHSAARGKMSARALVAFKHDNILGNAQAHMLLGRLKVSRADAGDKPARAYSADLGAPASGVLRTTVGFDPPGTGVGGKPPDRQGPVDARTVRLAGDRNARRPAHREGSAAALIGPRPRWASGCCRIPPPGPGAGHQWCSAGGCCGVLATVSS